MANQTASLEEVLAKMNDMVANDGGQLSLHSYDSEAQVLEVNYKIHVNEDCPTCTVSTDMVKIFLAESLRSHGVPVGELIVNEQ